MDEEFPDFLPLDFVLYLKKEPKNSIIMGWVDKVNRHGLSNSRYIVITELELFLYHKIRFHNEVELKKKITWFDITKVEFINKRALTLYFGQPTDEDDHEKFILRIKGAIVRKITKFLYGMFHGAFLLKERPEIVIDEEYQKPNIEENSVVQRLRIQMRKNGRIMNESTQSAVEKFLGSNPKQFRLDQVIHLIEVLPIFLGSLEFVPSITSIIVPCKLEIAPSLCAVLGEFVRNNNNIESISFIGKLPSNFGLFVDGYVENEDNHIGQLLFKKCELSSVHMEDFGRMIDSHYISRLHVVNSLDDSIVNSFFSLFSRPGFKNIVDLNIDRSFGVNIGKLMPFLGSVEVLSARLCNIELIDFFEALQQIEEPKLIDIQLGGNSNMILVGESVCIPKSIHSIQLDDISWNLMSFRNIFDQVLGLVPGGKECKINLSNAKMAVNDWDEFFKWVKNRNSDSLTKIWWNENPIHPQLFNFLSSCKNLKLIGFDGCFSDQEDDRINRKFLKHFIKTNKTVNIILLDGTPRKSLGKKGTMTVLKALQNNRTIKQITLSKNNAGNAILDNLSKCIAVNRTLEWVSIDGNNITNIKAYTSFFDKTRKRMLRFFIPWPLKEMRDFVQFREATTADVKYAGELYSKMLQGDNSVVRRPN